MDLFSRVAAPAGDDEIPADAHDQVMARLSSTPVSVDEIVRDVQFSAPVVLAVLTDLDLAGRIDWRPGNRVASL